MGKKRKADELKRNDSTFYEIGPFNLIAQGCGF